MEEKLSLEDAANPDAASPPAQNKRKCPTCGQEYNADQVLEYFHHNEPGPHEPIA